MRSGGARRSARYRRTVVIVIAMSVLLFGALIATVGSLNRDLYSASGFVRQYLDALVREDTVSALALPGVTPTDSELAAAGLPADIPSTLLRDSMVGSLDDIHLVSDTETADRVHTVVYGFVLGDKKSTMEFTVRHTGTFAGVFNSWRFEVSPLAVLQVTVQHESMFTVNGLTLDTRAQAEADAPASPVNQASYLGFAPNLYAIGHESRLLAAPTQEIPVSSSGLAAVTLAAEPNDTFISQVQGEVNRFLDKCAEQEVLQPSSCPFGTVIDDRVKSAPDWSITTYPQVTLAGGESDFEMPATEATAHIVVDVQSLFDGEMTTQDEDVPFAIALNVAIRPDGSIAIQLH